ARMLECTRGGGYRRLPERARHDAGPGVTPTPGPARFPQAVVGQTLVVAAWDTGAVPVARPGALRFEKAMAPISTTRETPAMVKRAASLSCRLMMAGSVRSATRFMTLISGFSAGPAVSLNGLLTVSPMTAALWASDPLPPWCPSSMYFLALSHAPPAFER